VRIHQAVSEFPADTWISLSITEWKPVTGSVPPLSAEDWESEFAKYRASPEFIQLNPRMDLHEFKKIYWMEWTHRLWGRVIGVTILVPTIYFIARRKVAPHMALKLVGICGLIGLQGAIGWWMVQSGLKDDLFTDGSLPRVSQYRLAAHLGTAFIAYGAMLLSGLSILREHRLIYDLVKGRDVMNALNLRPVRMFRWKSRLLTLLIFTTAMSGALVAGLDAGLIYNEFPWMGTGLTPPKEELFNPRYSRERDHSDLWWRNMLENSSLVQLDHRILATTTFTAVIALFLNVRFSSRLKNTLPKDVKKAVNGLVHLVSLQVVLGISTLIYMVPTWLAAAHQAGALALLTGAFILGSRLKISRSLAVRIHELNLQRRKTEMSHIARTKAATWAR
jgi:cytochrome c oxidase assembly protein subunit 15